MKLGILVPLNPTATPEFLHALGTNSERLGFHSLWVGEHVVMVDDYDPNFPVYEDGKMEHENAADNAELDAFTSLAYLAAITDKIRLGTGVIVLPQRNPVYTAKEAANVDWLSNGRLDLGVGLGWQKEEFEAVGASYEKRGGRSRSYIEVMKRLWCDPLSEHHDEFYDLRPCRFYPKPVQTPHPPVIFAGNSKPSFKRVAEQCQGWCAIGANPEQLAPQIADLETALAEANRPRSEVKVYAAPYGHDYDHEMIRQYKEVGVDELILLHFAKSVDELESLLNKLAEDHLDFVASL